MEPTVEEWKALYAAAVAFRDAAPWRWVSEEKVFGVQDPESGEIGYCCILGGAGEHFALVVYQGSEGLAGLWQMRSSPPSYDLTEILSLQKCLMASFEDRDMIQKEDLETIRRLGLKFRGKKAWPQFRSYLPGYMPWILTGAEARFLTIALQQALEMAFRLQKNPRHLPGVRPRGKYLVRVREKTDGGWEWKDTLVRPEPPAPHKQDLPSLDKARVERLAEELPPSDGILEVDYFYSPGAVREKEERPYFPFVLLAADVSSGMVLGMDVVPPAEIAARLPEKLMEIVEQLGMLPDKIIVQKEDVQEILRPLTKALGIQLIRSRRLRVVSALQGELSLFMGF